MTDIGTDELCHTASAEVAVDAQTAFEYLSDGLRQGEWTLGSWDRERLDSNLYRGRSLFDGRELYIRINRDEQTLVVDYEVGRKPESLLRVKLGAHRAGSNDRTSRGDMRRDLDEVAHPR